MSYWQLLKRLGPGVYRRRKMLAFFTFAATLITVLPTAYYLFKAPPRFRSSATVLLESRPDRVPLFQEFSPSRPLAVQVAILKSRSVAESVLEKLPGAAVQDLIESTYRVDYFEAIHNAYLRWRRVEREIPNPERRALQELREGRLKLESGSDGIVWLSAEASKPQVAVDIVNTYVDVLLSRTRSFNVDDARVSREFLETQLATVKQSLKANEDALRAFTAARGGIKIPDRSQATATQLSQIENELAEISTSRRMAQTRVQALREKSETQKRVAPTPAPGPAAPPSAAAPEIYRLRTQLTQLELALLDLRTRFTEEHPRVALTRERIAEMQRELGEAVKKTTPVAPAATVVPSADRTNFAEQVLALETASHTLVAQEDALRVQASAVRSELTGLSQSEQEYSRLVREVETNKTLDTLLSEKFHAARIREQGEMKVVKVIDPAGPPVPVTGERRLLVLLASFALALVAGAGVPTAIEWIHRRIETVEDVEAVNLSVLALLPQLSSRRPQFLPLVHQRRMKRLNDDGIFTEAFRNLRVAVQLAMHRDRFRSLLITSPVAAEGKSTVVVNLGWAFAEAGTRVILADIDFLRPALHKRLNVSASAAMAHALHNDGGLEAPLVSVGDRMWIAPGGYPFEPLTRGMLATDRLKDLLTDIGRQAEMVICDCSPILLVPDNLFLAAAVDAVIIVAKAGSTRCTDLARTKALLDGVGARLLGVVINELPPSTLRRQYNHYYNYSVRSQAS